MKYQNIREESVKLKVAQDFFEKFDCTDIKGFIDFAVKLKRPKSALEFEDEYLLWAEAKKDSTDIILMLAQLVLTIGKALNSKNNRNYLPPAFLGCFDCEKIAFVPYYEMQEIFYQNDFNWKVTSSDTTTKEFKQVYAQVKKVVETDIPWETYLFDFERDEKELRKFIKDNFIVGKSQTAKIRIDKNNFNVIYQKWRETVKPTIAINWDIAKQNNIIDGDFYLADLLSENNISLKDKLFVFLKSNFYEANRHIDKIGMFTSSRVEFTDNQKEYNKFWAKYERPPKKDYWDFMTDHRHLLVPQDVRERKGSYYTPSVWVEKSQEYLADVFGENWQEEYYIWDCCAGTGNLLAGLTNKYKIFASTLDKQDVAVMHDRIENGANLLHDNIFQFDFLNDSFDKLPENLQKIIKDEKRRKKLIIYINPPYAEASKMRTLQSGNEGSKGVEQSAVNKKYAHLLGQGNAELFAQFFTRIYCEIPGVVLAEFSKLKILQGQHFVNFRNFFLAKLEKMFVCPANTFDNVKGSFPIGFMIWNTGKKEIFKKIQADVYDKDGNFAEIKNLYALTDSQYINDWIKPFRAKKDAPLIIGKFPFKGNDFQNQNMIAIVNPETAYNIEAGQFLISPENLIVASIYFAVRKVIPADWLNDRDQFLYPNKKWEKDVEFHNDCLAYTLFNTNITSKNAANHWIPFKEDEINARTEYSSHFMVSFLSGKIVQNAYTDLFSHLKENTKQSKLNWQKGQKREFSSEATAVFDAGRKIWEFYHRQKNSNVNASLYDIREYFQGRENGRMNNTSANTEYNELIGNLRDNLKILAKKIEPKVYEYEFLKQ